MTTEMLDLEEELPRRERRRLVTPAGVIAAGVAIAAAGFFGGVQVQKSRGDSGGGTGAFAGGFAGAGGARQGAAGGAGAGRGQFGGGQTGAGGAGATAGGGQTGAGAAPGGQAGGAGAAPGAAGGAFAGATIGQVASVDGSTIYVDEQSGTTVKVKLAKGGKVTRTATAKASEIHPGDTVIVQGETADSGTVVASTIRATSSTAGGFGGFGG
ncbi:hypothetical protein [Solirubrobacter soli]|uniref:hypothetical protein n=1 Tax=Solirubrobacter soli TaxID=363832 RepID=UPI0012FBA883|nr:hypothetical protein [Solirubrobacter soli]